MASDGVTSLKKCFTRLCRESSMGLSSAVTHPWRHIYTTSVLQTSMYLWSSISAASCQGTFFPKQRSSTPLLFIKTTSMQRPICISLVDAFWSAGHLVACHLVAHGRIVTACKNIPATHNLVTKAKPPIHTLSVSVPQLSGTPTCHANKMSTLQKNLHIEAVLKSSKPPQ